MAHSYQRPTQRVPLDVLLEVARFSPQQTLSALMKTDRTLYHEVAKLLLRRRVVVDHLSDLSSFLAFLHAEKGGRCPHLRDLVLDVKLPSRASLTSIPQSLSRALQNYKFRSLASLRIDHAETVFGAHRDIPTGFASLTCLTSLIVCDAGASTLRALNGLKSGLRVLILKYEPGFDQIPAGSAERSHPTIICQNFSSTLETLDVAGYEAQLKRAKFPERYPRVQELTFDSPDCPLLAPYIHAFPDVRNLSMTTVFAGTLNPDNIPVEEDIIEAYRQSNQADQVEYGSWTKLETVTGTAPDIYLAGFRCAIEVLYLNVCFYDPLWMVLSVLQDAPVTTLHLFVHNIDALDDVDGLPMVFRQLSTSSLESLFLHIRLCAQEEWEDDLKIIADSVVMGRFLQSLRSLPIRKFHFTLRCEYSTYSDGCHDPSSPRICGAQKLQDFDCEDFAQRVLATVPAAHDVDVRFACSRSQRATAHRT